MALIKCFECGNQISENAQFCTNCGVSINKENIVIENKTNNNSMHTLINIFSIIFISMYSIFSLYMVYTNIKTFFEYIDNITLVSFCSDINNIIYYLGSAILLWMLYLYNIKQTKIFKIIGGIILAAMVFVALIYYTVGLFTWTDSIEYFFELIGNILQIFFGYYGLPIALYLLYINKK